MGNIISETQWYQDPLKMEESHYSWEKTIFISHRSTDKGIADILLNFFMGIGINREAVFCSSLPGNDVNEKIPNEVKEALRKSQINIAILSKEFYESAYCLNEAGILWFQSAPVIPIAMPEIHASNMYGFLNNDYKLRRLDIDDDIAYICDAVLSALSLPQAKASVITRETRKLIDAYKKYLSDRTPLPHITAKEEKTPLEQIVDSLEHPDEWQEEDGVYYHKAFPQHRVVIEMDDLTGFRSPRSEFYHYVQSDTSAYYGILKIFCGVTQIYSCQVTALDNFKVIVPCPKRMSIELYRDEPDIVFRSYVVSDIKYKLLVFLTEKAAVSSGHEADIAVNNLMEVVLTFQSEEDRKDFMMYVRENVEAFLSLFAKEPPVYIEAATRQEEDLICDRLRDAYALKKMQISYNMTKKSKP